MKKLFFLLVVALMAAPSLQAQSALELAKQQRELNEFNTKILKAKPTKSVKKEAKKLENDGWLVPVGEKTIAQQIMASQLYAEELMVDEEGITVKRYLSQPSVSKAGSYNAAYAAARANIQIEVASMIKTEIVAAMQTKIDNNQSSAISASTMDKFNQRAKAVVDQTLTAGIPLVTIYRRDENGNFEVQVRIAYDKQQLSAHIKKNLAKEFEQEGDELNKIVDEVLKSKF